MPRRKRPYVFKHFHTKGEANYARKVLIENRKTLTPDAVNVHKHRYGYGLSVKTKRQLDTARRLLRKRKLMKKL